MLVRVQPPRGLPPPEAALPSTCAVSVRAAGTRGTAVGDAAGWDAGAGERGVHSSTGASHQSQPVQPSRPKVHEMQPQSAGLPAVSHEGEAADEEGGGASEPPTSAACAA